MNTIIIEELSEITGFKVSTLRPYMQGYRFTKYETPVQKNGHKRIGYIFNQAFVDEFTQYIWIKKRYDIRECLQKKLLLLEEQEK